MNKIISILPFLSLFGIIVFFESSTYVTFGTISFLLLHVIMFSRPLRDIFPKHLSFLDYIVRIRKELGILAGVFAIVHSLGYFLDTNISLILILNPNIWYLESFLAWGILAFSVSIPLLITSNKYSVIKLGKKWKKLQYLAYLMYIFTILHVAFIKEEEFILMMILLFIYLSVLGLSIFLNNKRLKESSSVKYLCVPCGWIYDESIGDPDSGIMPGTKFEDIPEDWVCPVCGVGKKDFIIVSGKTKLENIKSKIIGISYINENKDVIELEIENTKKLTAKPGQFFTFDFIDNDGEFSRSYSISEINSDTISFLIKIYDDGRAGKILKGTNIGDFLYIRGPFGDFILRENNFKKVFIASGTGLAPIYNMLLNIPECVDKDLLFGVKTKQDLFYLDALKNFKNLNINIYLSKDNYLDDDFKYLNSRISLDKYLEKIDTSIEFYICGNPSLVEDSILKLKNFGYKKIYFEKF